MKTAMNRRTYNNNRVIRNRANINKFRSSMTVAALVAVVNFGLQAFSFLRNLVTIGGDPFGGLNRGQLKKMYWLQYVVA